MPYYVYILLCKNGSYYTGYTKDVDSRMKMHKTGKGARYTKMHKPKKLVYIEEFSTRKDAMRRERKIKAMNHKQKKMLTKKYGLKSKKRH
ncbi:MAG: GIY-YIG nuclease family protein [Candidatus Bathyarchaeia archaeon]